MKKLMLYLIPALQIVAGMMFTLATPAVAHALVAPPDPIPQYTWVDWGTIIDNVNNNTYIDPNPDDSTNIFYRQNDPDPNTDPNGSSCTGDYIDVDPRSNPSQGKLTIVSAGAVTATRTVAPCTKSAPSIISIGYTYFNNAYFQWVDAGQIQNLKDATYNHRVAGGRSGSTSVITVPSKSLFVYDNTTHEFVYNSTDGCKSSIKALPGALSGTIVYRKLEGSSCYESPAQNIDLARPVNATLAAGTGTAAGNPADASPQCDAGPGFSFIVCPVANGAAGAVTVVTNIMTQLLKVVPLNTAPTDPIFKLWGIFRNIANIFFVLVFFVVIFGTTIGMDNYTVKKILPKLIAAAVLVQFSYWIAGFIIDIGNVLGYGIRYLVDTAGIGTTFSFPDGSSAAVVGVSGLLALAILIPAAWGITFTAILGALLAALTVVGTLLVRQIMVVLLVVLSPLAFVAWVLPNTENLFKFWYKNLLRAILLFPLIMLLLMSGRVFSTVAQTVMSRSDATSAFAGAIGIIAYILPLFLIPATFKMSGSLMGMAGAGVSKLSGAANKRWGKGSESDKARTENRRLNNARRIAESKTGFGRSLARKRGGFGSMYSEVPGLKRIPGIGQSGVQRAAQGKAIGDNATQEQSLATSEIFAQGLANDGGKLSAWAKDQGRSPNQRQAAIDRLVKIGAYDELEKLRTSGAMTETAWQTAMEKHRRDVRGAGNQPSTGKSYSDVLLRPPGAASTTTGGGGGGAPAPAPAAPGASRSAPASSRRAAATPSAPAPTPAAPVPSAPAAPGGYPGASPSAPAPAPSAPAGGYPGATPAAPASPVRPTPPSTPASPYPGAPSAPVPGAVIRPTPPPFRAPEQNNQDDVQGDDRSIS